MGYEFVVGKIPLSIFLRCRAGWVYRFCFPVSICCLDKTGGRPDKVLCFHLDRTYACVTKYSHFGMTKWVALAAGSRIALFIKLWYTMDNNEMTEEISSVFQIPFIGNRFSKEPEDNIQNADSLKAEL